MAIRDFGNFATAPVGSCYPDRAGSAAAGIRPPLVAGISGSEKDGADSIVMSGGYEDDEDYGDVVIYTGHGGNDPNTGKQIADQHWTRGNLPSERTKPMASLCVIRGGNLSSPYAPTEGFRYHGLYFVEHSWRRKGNPGFRYVGLDSSETTLRRQPGSPQSRTNFWVTLHHPKRPQRFIRVVRNTAVVQTVKQLHEFSANLWHHLNSAPPDRTRKVRIQPLSPPPTSRRTRHD